MKLGRALKCNFLLILVSLQCFSTVPLFSSLKNQDVIFDKNIKEITEDKKGIIWIGTSSGLYTYNGYDFNKIIVNKNHENIRVNKVYIDSNENIWVGTFKLGLFKLIDNKWESFNFMSSSPTAIYDIIEDKNGDLYIATNLGLKYISAHSDIELTLNNNYLSHLTSPVYSIAIYGNNQIIVGSKSFFSIIHTLDKRTLRYEFSNPDIWVHDLYIDDNEKLWIGSNKGLLQFDLKNKNFIKNEISINKRVLKIIEHNDDVWIATIGDGIYKINTIDNEISNYIHNKSSGNSLMENNIYTLYISRDNTLWLGGFFKGIDVLPLSTLNFGYENNTHNSFYCLVGEAIPTALVDKKNTLWMGTLNGLVKSDNTNECEYFTVSSQSNNSLVELRSIVDFDDKIWMLLNKNIASFDKFTENIKHYNINIPTSVIFMLRNIHGGGFYIGTFSGLYYFSQDKESIKLVTSENPLLSSSTFNSYFQRDNNLYFATSSGIAVLNKDNHLQYHSFINSYIEPNNITAMTRVNNKYYFGIDHDGLISLDEYGKVTQIFKKDILIRSIIEYDNNLWMGTNSGLYRVDLLKNTIKLIHKKDGTNNTQYYSNASFKTKNSLFFGGTNGFIRFNPKNINLNKFNSKIILSKFTLLNKEIISNLPTENGFKLTKPIDELDLLELGYKDSIIGFEFAALDYADSMRNRYAYRLKGLYDNWVYVDANNRHATFTNLKSGDYTFQVKASNKDDVWSKTFKELKIKIYPAPWLSSWAYFSYFVITILSIWAFIRYKTIASRKRAEQLELTVKERTLEVNLQKKMVESLLDHKNEVFANITHEFKTPLTLILGPVNQLVNEAEFSIHSDKLYMIQRNARRLILMVGQILKLSQAESNKEVIREAQAVQPTLTMLYESFKPLANSKNIDFILKNHIQANIYATTECLEIVVGNLISNALKFTNTGGKIIISAKINDKNISISIKDTGTGIEKTDLEKIFKRFTRLNTHKRIQGTGIGLSVVKEITEANNGQVNVNSQWGEGSEFILTFPLTDIDTIQELSHAIVDQLVDNTTNELTIDYKGSMTSNKGAKKRSPNSITVLIVEDNLDMQTHIGNVLKNRFYCLFADRGRTGIALALEKSPDVIICDVMMPSMNGYQVTRILRHDSRTSHIPIILLTALNTKESRIKGWRENIDIYVTKPFDATELNAQLDNILTIRKILQQKTNNAVKNNSSLKGLDLSQQDLKFIKKFKSVIDKYYSNEYFQKADLASKMAVSERHLQRKIKALIDENPMEMLRDYRLEKAAIQLNNGFQVGIVSDECGFSSVSYFGSCFKKKYGVTPKKYQLLK